MNEVEKRLCKKNALDKLVVVPGMGYWYDAKKFCPPDDTEVDVIMETGEVVKEMMYWNLTDGYDGFTEPFGSMVLYWRPLK